MTNDQTKTEYGDFSVAIAFVSSFEVRHWAAALGILPQRRIRLIAGNANEVACVVAEHSRAVVRDDASALECVPAYQSAFPK